MILSFINFLLNSSLSNEADSIKTLLLPDHWKEHFENKLVPEYFKKDHKCKKCGFDASNLSLDDKILHIARYHQIGKKHALKQYD